MRFSKSVLKTAVYITAAADKMPDTALFTEEDFEIEKTAVFPAAHTAEDMFGEFILGNINGKYLLYRKINETDNNLFYRDLINCLKIKNVTVAVNACPLKKTHCGFMEIRDFIRFGTAAKTGENRMKTQSGGIYAVLNSDPTEAEKYALSVLGADAVGKNTLPIVLMSENINLKPIMMFERGNVNEPEI